MLKHLIVAAAGVTLAASGLQAAAPSGLSGSQIIAARQAGMDMSSVSFRSMAEAIKAGREVKAEGYSATALSKWAKAVPSLFPAGTGKDELPDTQALKAIWSDREGFERVAANYAAATAELALRAKANDTRAFIRQLLVVDQACRSCHNRFKEGMQSPPLDLTAP